MRGLPGGTKIKVPAGWEATAFFERAAAALGTGALLETTPLDADGKLRAAKVSPKELFDCLRFQDFRDYCRILSEEKQRREKAGYVDVGKLVDSKAGAKHVGD